MYSISPQVTSSNTIVTKKRIQLASILDTGRKLNVHKTIRRRLMHIPFT